MSKRIAVFADVQKHCLSNAIIASSTSGFKPSQLQERLSKPEQLIVAHPFNLVYLLPLIELVGDPNTSAAAAEHLRSIGMFPLLVRKEIDAHIADRFLEAVWREGLWLIKDLVRHTVVGVNSVRRNSNNGMGIRCHRVSAGMPTGMTCWIFVI